MKWWIGLIITLISASALLASSLIARHLYKQKNDFWLIALFPIGWGTLFTITGITLTVSSLLGIL